MSAVTTIPTRVESTPDFDLLMKLLSKITLWHFGEGPCQLDVRSSPTEVQIRDRRGVRMAILYKPEIEAVLNEVIGRR